MPFNSTTGVFTPPDGSENAAPGLVIRSAVWNAIFTDIATALTELAQLMAINPRTASSGSFSVTTTDTLILVTANAPVITLPACATKVGRVTILGAATGIFSLHNSVLTPQGGETISGESTVTLSIEHQVATLYPLSAGGYIIA